MFLRRDLRQPGPITTLLSSQLPELGIPTHFLLGSELGGLKMLLETGAGLVFFETPTNPHIGSARGSEN